MNLIVKTTDHEVKAALRNLLAKVGDLKPVMDRIGLYYLKSVQENFDKQSSPDGTPWQKLSAATLMMTLGTKRTSTSGRISRPYLNKRGALSAKGRTYLQGKRILIESNDLRNSIRHQADSHSVTIGTDIPYAAIHQFGGMAGRGRKVKIPARPYLAVNRGKELELADKDKKMILDIIYEQLNPSR